MVKVSIAGATGYTGFELIRILIRHPQVELVSLTSETYIGQCITDVFPALRGWIKKKLVSLQSDLPASDYIFMALPHATAMERVPEFLERGVKVIDLSADFRLHDSKVFEAWYHTTHLKPDYLKEAVYGLPEIHRDQIKNARLVANPGCYPTSIILGFAPLFQSDWIDPESIVADSKSGVSGAGRLQRLLLRRRAPVRVRDVSRRRTPTPHRPRTERGRPDRRRDVQDPGSGRVRSRDRARHHPHERLHARPPLHGVRRGGRQGPECPSIRSLRPPQSRVRLLHLDDGPCTLPDDDHRGPNGPAV